jgi:hypothetical protein
MANVAAAEPAQTAAEDPQALDDLMQSANDLWDSYAGPGAAPDPVEALLAEQNLATGTDVQPIAPVLQPAAASASEAVGVAAVAPPGPGSYSPPSHTDDSLEGEVSLPGSLAALSPVASESDSPADSAATAGRTGGRAPSPKTQPMRRLKRPVGRGWATTDKYTDEEQDDCHADHDNHDASHDGRDEDSHESHEDSHESHEDSHESHEDSHESRGGGPSAGTRDSKRMRTHFRPINTSSCAGQDWSSP